jgi:transposase InsO family protein
MSESERKPLIITKVDDEGVDVWLRDGVVIELAREHGDRLAVWALRIDGRRYREPRDLTSEPLPADSRFVREVRAAMKEYGG